MRYRVVISWSAADEAYVATVPDLRGCMAHGPTYEAALTNIQDAAQLWLDTAREDGSAIPEPTEVSVAGT